MAVVNNFVLVIEDKADLNKHVKLTDTAILETSIKAVTDYALNGAYFYAKHIAQNSPFKKVFAKRMYLTALNINQRQKILSVDSMANL